MRATYADDRYRVIREIGRGGMSVVYEVEDARLGARRALKVLHAPLMSQPEIVARFRNEARVLASLSHPHIVGVVDVGEEDGALWIVMELLPGGSLAEWAARRGGLSPEEASAAMIGVLDALRLAHASGVVHRDVKPQNILLADGGVPKLADFGIAQLATDDLTRTGMLLGSWATMAPEQRSDAKKVGPPSDLWSAAATIVALVEGRAVVDLHVLEQRVHTLSRWPAPIAAVLHRALAYAPEQRFPSAADMAEALRSALAEARGDAAPPPTAAPSAPLSRVSAPKVEATPRPARGSRVALASAAIVAGVAGSAAGFVLALRDDVRTRVVAEPESVQRTRAHEALPVCPDAPTEWERQQSPRFITGESGGLEAGGGRLVDVDGDGFTDAVFPHKLGNEFRVFFGSADATLPEASLHVPALRMAGSTGTVDAGDLDGDGLPELIAVATENMGFVVSRGTGPRAFAPGVMVDSGDIPVAVRIVDLDGDGTNDLLAALAGMGTDLSTLAWRRGTGNALRFDTARILLRDGVGVFDAADIDGDGRVELIVADYDHVRVYPLSDDTRMLPSTAEWAHPLGPASALRVLRTPDGPRILVGAWARDRRGRAVSFAPDGSSCAFRLDDAPAYDFGYFNADARVDYLTHATCPYCTSSYMVFVGTR